MGKCKRRTLHKTSTTSYFMTRETAVNNVFRIFNEKFKESSKKKNNDIKVAMDTISLFGISAEELSEAGLSYENLKALGSAID